MAQRLEFNERKIKYYKILNYKYYIPYYKRCDPGLLPEYDNFLVSLIELHMGQRIQKWTK